MLERYSATVPLRTTDREDVPLALIPVAGHDRPAIIEADDHRQLLSHGHFDRLELWGSDPRRYVVAISRVGSSIIVARMVGNAGRSGYVAHTNGDPCDLTRGNLKRTRWQRGRKA